MRYVILLFIVLLIAIWLGLWISEDSGYVLISYNHWSVQTSFWIGLAILLISFAVVYFVVRIIVRISNMPEKIQRWKRMRNYKKARVLTNIGLCQLAEGHWTNAEKTLLHAARLTKYPLIDYLGAARAAAAQQDHTKRDEYLRLAAKSTKGAEMAVGITQAELQIQSHQWEQALATLKRLNQINPQQGYVLKLLAKIFIELGDWQELSVILPSLTKTEIYKEEELNRIYETTLTHLLQKQAKSGIEALERYWDDLPRKWRHNPTLQKTYAKALLDAHQDQLAVDFIEKTLKNLWDRNLVRLYGEARGESPAHQLKIAEGWYKKHSSDATLLICLGSLSMHEKFWGKAVEYFEKSIQLKPSCEAYRALGQTYEALGQEHEALQCYRKGLQHKSL